MLVMGGLRRLISPRASPFSFRTLLYLLSTAVLLVRSSYILDQAEQIYPNPEEREKNLIGALDTLKRLRLETATENEGHTRKPRSNVDATVLCVTFIEPAFQHLAVAEYNMKASVKYCDDWGVLYVGDDDLKVMQSLEKSASANNVTLQFIEQSKTAQEILEKFGPTDQTEKILKSKIECKSIPKSFLLIQIIPFAKKYNYVWLLDSDISFESFEIEKFFHTMKNLPQSPLLLQPVIGTNDRPHTRLNANYYIGKQTKSHIAPSNIIEIMLPMMDSGFLVWFTEYFMKPMMPIAYAVSGDFGSDLIWCRASALYLEIGLDVKDYRARANSACIVITHTPITHLDWENKASPPESKEDSQRLTSLYTHMLDGVKELRYRFLPQKNEGKVDMQAMDTKVEDKVEMMEVVKKSKQQIWRESHPGWDDKYKKSK